MPSAADPLRKVYLEITTACNLDCAMCIRRVWDAGVESMTRPTYEELLADLRAIGSDCTIHFGGFGEPLAHPDFLDYVCQAKAAGLRVEVTTNGVLLDEHVAKAVVDLEVDGLYVSMDGPGTREDGPFHAEGAAAAQANLRRLSWFRFSRGATKPETAIVFVASRRNIGALPEMRRLAWEVGIQRVLVTNLIAYSPELEPEILYGRWTVRCSDVAPTPWNPAVDLPRIDPCTEVTRAMDQLAVRGSSVSVRGAPVYGSGMICRFAHEGRLAIDPAGRVSPCLPLLHAHHYYFRGARHDIRSFYFGRIVQTSLGEIWDSPAYRSFRDRVRRFEFSPCIDCAACDLRETNEDDCYGSGLPSCGDCLWAAGFIQCP